MRSGETRPYAVRQSHPRTERRHSPKVAQFAVGNTSLRCGELSLRCVAADCWRTPTGSRRPGRITELRRGNTAGLASPGALNLTCCLVASFSPLSFVTCPALKCSAAFNDGCSFPTPTHQRNRRRSGNRSARKPSSLSSNSSWACRGLSARRVPSKMVGFFLIFLARSLAQRVLWLSLIAGVTSLFA
jgi:hypothetical protein